MILEEFQVMLMNITHNIGIYKFKKGFNGDFVEFVGELYMVFKPVTNFAFNTLGEAYRNLQIKKARKKNQ